MIKSIQVQHNETMEKMFSYAKEAGFESVALGFGSSKVFHSDNWEVEILRIKDKLSEYELSCVGTHLPYYHLLITAEEKDEVMEEAIKRCIKATRMLGGNVTVFHPRSSVKYDYSVKHSFEENKKDIKSYIPTAESNDVIIALENLPIFPGMPKGRFYSWNYVDLCELADSFNSKNIGICWDFGHAHLTGINQEAGLKTIGERLAFTHIHDNFSYADLHLAPGIGHIEWKKLMPVLKEIGYAGPLNLELAYEDSKTLKSYVAHNFDCINLLEEFMCE